MGHEGPQRPRVEHTKLCLGLYLPSKDMSPSKVDSIGKPNSGYSPAPLTPVLEKNRSSLRCSLSVVLFLFTQMPTPVMLTAGRECSSWDGGSQVHRHSAESPDISPGQLGKRKHIHQAAAITNPKPLLISAKQSSLERRIVLPYAHRNHKK